jgi:hypothetical protein
MTRGGDATGVEACKIFADGCALLLTFILTVGTEFGCAAARFRFG